MCSRGGGVVGCVWRCSFPCGLRIHAVVRFGVRRVWANAVKCVQSPQDAIALCVWSFSPTILVHRTSFK
jgi:hypothetical protein